MSDLADRLQWIQCRSEELKKQLTTDPHGNELEELAGLLSYLAVIVRKHLESE